MAKVVRQINLWESLNQSLSSDIEIENQVGPFGVLEEEISVRGIVRKLDCGFYDACLSLAAQKNWNSFTCKGCFNACQT